MTALEEAYPLGPIHHLADLYLPQMFTDLLTPLLLQVQLSKQVKFEYNEHLTLYP